MDEKKLTYISLMGTLFGIIGLIIVSNLDNITAIQDINEDMLNHRVTIISEITNIEMNEEIYLLNLKDDTGEIKGVIFEDKDLMLDKFIELKITGKVTKYREDFQIEIVKIEYFPEKNFLEDRRF